MNQEEDGYYSTRVESEDIYSIVYSIYSVCKKTPAQHYAAVPWKQWRSLWVMLCQPLEVHPPVQLSVMVVIQ